MAVATLPMYDPPALAWATDALWEALRDALARRGVAAPPLTRDADHAAAWRRPDLLLSQTCGWPYATALRGAVRLVVTPVYAAEGCAGPCYRSAIVVRAGDAARDLAACRGKRVAINAVDSQSGCHALRAAVAPLAAGGAFFAGVALTGGHAASAQAVAEGRADVAALDCVSWALMRRVEPGLAARLRVIGWTPAAPGLPLITAASTDDATVAALRAAVLETLAAPATAEPRSALLIEGAAALDDAAYDRILAMAAAADALGAPPLV